MSELYPKLVRGFSSLQVFKQKVLNYHWNVTGPSFYETHLVLQRVYESLEGFVDRFAESIRVYGRAPGLYTVYIQVSSVKENLTIPAVPSMYTELISDIRLLKADVLSSLEAAEVDREHGVLNLLGELVETIDKISYLIESSQEGFNL